MNTQYNFLYAAPRIRPFVMEEGPPMSQRAFLREPSALFQFWNDTVARTFDFEPEKEHIVVVGLNPRGRSVGWNKISTGSATASLCHPREVFRAALCMAAVTGIVLMHNHPSGDPYPSHADICLTKQLRDAAKILNIEFVDHVVIGEASADPSGLGWYSFRSNGMFQ